MPDQDCQSAERARERVLLVDDDQNLLDSFRRLLKDDFELFTAEDG